MTAKENVNFSDEYIYDRCDINLILEKTPLTQIDKCLNDVHLNLEIKNNWNCYSPPEIEFSAEAKFNFKKSSLRLEFNTFKEVNNILRNFDPSFVDLGRDYWL